MGGRHVHRRVLPRHSSRPLTPHPTRTTMSISQHEHTGTEAIAQALPCTEEMLS